MTLLAVTLLALVGNQTLWELRLRSSGPESCTLLQVKAGGKSEPKVLPISGSDCTQARKLLQEIVKAVSRPDFQDDERTPPPFDEPSYRMTVDRKTLSVAFQAPEECTILPNGQEKCEKKNLSPQQKLLLILRARSHR